jgi:hypothetical protein
MRKDQAGVVEATAFVLRDENSLERASLKMVAGGPQLALRDSKGNARAVLRVCSEATQLCFLDGQGRRMITLTSLGSAQMLDLYNAHGADGVSMVAAGNALFGLSDGDKWRVHLVANDHPELQERPCFVVTDRRGREQVTVAAGPDGPELSLRGPNEKHRLRLKVVKGKPYVQMLDGRSREVCRLDVDGQITKPRIRKRQRR